MNNVLDDSQAFWDAHAVRDPLWAVLSDRGKDGRRWDVSRFFQTGINELALVFYELESHGIQVARGDALDFGCGVGRLSQALAARFQRVVGVDVSPRMIDAARNLNRFPDRVSYASNDQPNLRRFRDGTFDFAYTNLVLQHIPPALTRTYLRELIRTLTPGGILVFQLPSHQRAEHEPVPAAVATPMPDEAYRAAISIEGLPPVLKPGIAFTIDARVTNVSPTLWSRQSFGAITIGNHWLDGTEERTLRRDDGRTPLPDTLAPGATCWIPLTINTPADEGDYRCEFDLAHEAVRWFEDRGSKVVRIPIAVRADEPQGGQQTACEASQAHPPSEHDVSSSARPSSAAPGDPDAPDPGDFPMHGVHGDEIVALIAACGAELLMRGDDSSCGVRWVSYRYVVRKCGGGDVG